jgi:hypothetical protein
MGRHADHMVPVIFKSAPLKGVMRVGQVNSVNLHEEFHFCLILFVKNSYNSSQ